MAKLRLLRTGNLTRHIDNSGSVPCVTARHLASSFALFVLACGRWLNNTVLFVAGTADALADILLLEPDMPTKVEYEFEFDVEAAADFIPHMRKRHCNWLLGLG